jgi:hypothetical protein
MPAISVTRLELRGYRFLPSFFVHTIRSQSQLVGSLGYLGGGTAMESLRSFWTITAWRDGDAMRAFRNGSAHLKAMRRLIDICCAASYAHWQQDSTELPTLEQAHARMLAEGKLSKVRHPSALQQSGRAATDKVPRGWRPAKPRLQLAD